MAPIFCETGEENLDIVQSLGIGLGGGGNGPTVIFDINDQGGKGLDLEKEPFPIIVQRRSVDRQERLQLEIVEWTFVLSGKSPSKNCPSDLGWSRQKDPVLDISDRFLGRCDLVENL